MQKAVKILNPLPGGQSYTSIKRTQHFIRRGIAIMDCGMLKFVELIQQRRLLHVEERSNWGDAMFWNGSPRQSIVRHMKTDGIWRARNLMHKPGEVRS